MLEASASETARPEESELRRNLKTDSDSDEEVSFAQDSPAARARLRARDTQQDLLADNLLMDEPRAAHRIITYGKRDRLQLEHGLDVLDSDLFSDHLAYDDNVHGGGPYDDDVDQVVHNSDKGTRDEEESDEGGDEDEDQMTEQARMVDNEQAATDSDSDEDVLRRPATDYQRIRLQRNAATPSTGNLTPEMEVVTTAAPKPATTQTRVRSRTKLVVGPSSRVTRAHVLTLES